MAEALCGDGGGHGDEGDDDEREDDLRRRAVRDYSTISHSLTLTEWLSFLIKPEPGGEIDGIADDNEDFVDYDDGEENDQDAKGGGIADFIALPLPGKTQKGDKGKGPGGSVEKGGGLGDDGDDGVSPFERHIRQLALHLLQTRYDEDTARDTLRRSWSRKRMNPKDEQNNLRKVKHEHSSARFHDDLRNINGGGGGGGGVVVAANSTAATMTNLTVNV